MKLVHGFKLVTQTEVAEYACLAKIYEHAKTGARVLSMINQDENKVFGITLRTPPPDSTGVAHILEHSVLCGSKKYPVKEPFVEILKSSLQTFLNALTFPDKTCYPVASTNLQDFYNLVDVYLDAVFFPRLTPNTLKQEGWHFEPSPNFKKDKSLEFKGVVFNEMKGAYSSPDSLLSQYTQQSLFPDTTYSLDSGGDPATIPQLTFEAFMDFHQTHYHPSNAYAFFWGNDDPEERLHMLDNYFSRFERGHASAQIELQAKFASRVRIEKPFAASEGDEGSMFTTNFGLPETADPDLNLRLHVLEHILIGLPSSPLRKALLDSGLGEDVTGVGLEADLRQLYFSVGLKGIALADVAEAEAVVERVLTDLADGVHPHDVEAAINSVEFERRENNSGSYPRGLLVMFQTLSTWLYNGDPLALLTFDAPFARLKKEVDNGHTVFERLIQTHFLDNPHRSTVIISPDPDLARTQADEERARLDAAKNAMSKAELARIPKEAAELFKLQGRHDDPKALATIPRLQLDDLPRRNTIIPIEAYEKGEARTLLHVVDTNGLVYLDLGFDLMGLPDRLMGYIPVFGRALLEMGTETQDYVTLQNRIARKTGGITPQTFNSQVLGNSDTVAKLFLRGKATAQRAEELVDILLEVLMLGSFKSQERFRQIVLEEKARFERRIVPAGHSLVATRLRARMNEAGWIEEQFSGLTALTFLRDLAKKVDQDYDSVLADLNEIRERTFSKRNLIINITSDEDDFMRVTPGIAALTRALPDAGANRTKRVIPSFAPAEGLSIPAQVNYVGKGVNLTNAGLDFPGGSEAVSRFLRTSYLWDKVRVQGGAYGAFSLFDRLGSTLSFVSYRDPNLDETVALFDAVGKYLRKSALSDDDIEKNIIGTIGMMDDHLLPDAKGFASMIRYLTGVTPEWRQQTREEILATSSDDFRNFAKAAVTLAQEGDVVVLGNAESLEKSKLDFKITKVL